MVSIWFYFNKIEKNTFERFARLRVDDKIVGAVSNMVVNKTAEANEIILIWNTFYIIQNQNSWLLEVSTGRLLLKEHVEKWESKMRKILLLVRDVTIELILYRNVVSKQFFSTVNGTEQILPEPFGYPFDKAWTKPWIYNLCKTL